MLLLLFEGVDLEEVEHEQPVVHQFALLPEPFGDVKAIERNRRYLYD